MRLLSVLALLQKEVKTELRRKSVIAGITLYLFSLVFVCYLTFNLNQAAVNQLTWSALFWLTLLFSCINTVAKSFIGERPGQADYLFSLSSASETIIAKIVYNFLLCFLLSMVGLALFSVLLPVKLEHWWLLVLTIVLTSFAFSGSLNLISGIASRARNANVVMAVLSFPSIMAILLLAVKITKNVVDGLDTSASNDDLLNLAATSVIVNTLTYLLFPFVWRS